MLFQKHPMYRGDPIRKEDESMVVDGRIIPRILFLFS